MSADERQSNDWVSQVGIAWALDEAPCPPELLATLIAIARRVNNDGKNSWQSVGTIAEKVGKSKDQVKTEIKKLKAEGLIVEGDQSILDKILRPGQRPTVYDVALSKRGPKPARAPRNPSGKNDGKATPSGRGGMDTTPGMDTTGGIETPNRGGMDTPSTGGTDTPQINQVINQEESSLSAAQDPPVSATDEATPGERERSSSESKTKHPSAAYEELAKIGIERDEADRLIPLLVAEHRPRYASWWRTVGGNGDLADLVAQVRIAADEFSAAAERLARAEQLRRAPRCERHVQPQPCQLCADEAASSPSGQAAPPRRCPHCKQFGSPAVPPPNPCPKCNPNPGGAS